MFQTPVGNSFLCNRRARRRVRQVPTVSNPCREFVPLQSRWFLFIPSWNPSFQTLVFNWFLCNGRMQPGDAAHRQVSNPCREFVPLQSHQDHLSVRKILKFQTPVGNSFLCNSKMFATVRLSGSSFKPLSGIRSSAISPNTLSHVR